MKLIEDLTALTIKRDMFALSQVDIKQTRARVLSENASAQSIELAKAVALDEISRVTQNEIERVDW